MLWEICAVVAGICSVLVLMLIFKSIDDTLKVEE